MSLRETNNAPSISSITDTLMYPPYQDIRSEQGGLEVNGREPLSSRVYTQIADDYIARQCDTEPLHHRTCQELVAAIPVVERRRQTGVSVCIAAASHQENDSLYNSLCLYADQTLDRPFEIIVYANRPRLDRTGRPTHDVGTARAVDAVRGRHPDLSITLLEKVYDGDAGIGTIKRTLYDSVVRIHAERHTVDPILIFNDADTISLSPRYLQSIVDSLQADPQAAAIAGNLEWDRVALSYNPVLWISTRAYQLINAAKRADTNGHILAGANTAVRASAYCDSGGTPAGGRGEDISLGRRLKMVGQTGARILSGDSSTLLETSARRSLYAASKGLAPNEKWRLGFSAFDDEVRMVDIPDNDYTFARQPDRQRFIHDIQYMLTRVVRSYEHDDPLGLDASMYQLALGKLGLTYHVTRSEEGCTKLEIREMPYKLIRAIVEARSMLRRMSDTG